MKTAEQVQFRIYITSVFKQGQTHIQGRILSALSRVVLYEDPMLQAKARSVVPVSDLKLRASAHIPQFSTEDAFLNELLAW